MTLLPPQAEQIIAEMLACAPPLTPEQQDILRHAFTPPRGIPAPAA